MGSASGAAEMRMSDGVSAGVGKLNNGFVNANCGDFVSSGRPGVAQSGGHGRDKGRLEANQEPAARSRGLSVSPGHLIESSARPGQLY